MVRECRSDARPGEDITMSKSRLLNSLVVLLTAFGLVFVGTLAHAQNVAPVHWSAEVKGAHGDYRPGQKLEVEVTAEIDDGWHMYSYPQPPHSPVKGMEITVPEGQPIEIAGGINSPKPESKMDPVFGAETRFYVDSASFTIPLKVKKKAPAGSQKLEFDVRYQMCDDHLCLPPRTDKLEVTLQIAGRS